MSDSTFKDERAKGISNMMCKPWSPIVASLYFVLFCANPFACWADEPAQPQWIGFLQQRVYMQYDSSVADSAKKMDLDAKLATALGMRDSSTVESLFNLSDEKSLQSAWEPIRLKLSPKEWYLSVHFDPLSPSPNDRLISVICGRIAERNTQDVKVGDKDTRLDVIRLTGDPIVDRKSFDTPSIGWTCPFRQPRLHSAGVLCETVMGALVIDSR